MWRETGSGHRVGIICRSSSSPGRAGLFFFLPIMFRAYHTPSVGTTTDPGSGISRLCFATGRKTRSSGRYKYGSDAILAFFYSFSLPLSRDMYKSRTFATFLLSPESTEADFLSPKNDGVFGCCNTPCIQTAFSQRPLCRVWRPDWDR